MFFRGIVLPANVENKSCQGWYWDKITSTIFCNDKTSGINRFMTVFKVISMTANADH